MISARTPEETHALLAAALNSGDIDAFADVYEEHAKLIVPPAGALTSGREAIRSAVEPTFALKPRAEIEVVKKLLGDGLALTHARWSLVGTDLGGSKVGMHGRGTIVSRQQRDGSWLIALDDPMSPC